MSQPRSLARSAAEAQKIVRPEQRGMRFGSLPRSNSTNSIRHRDLPVLLELGPYPDGLGYAQREFESAFGPDAASAPGTPGESGTHGEPARPP